MPGRIPRPPRGEIVSVLVTGGGGGIGSAIARAFEARGQTAIRQDLRDSPEIDAHGDLLDDDNLRQLVDTCRRSELDTVVAAHGIAGAGEIREITSESALRTLRVNTISVLRLYQTLSEMLAARDGSFIVVSSQAGLAGEASNGIYAASKFALVGWAQSISIERGSPRMRVICPGMVETPLLVAGLTGMAEASGTTYERFLAKRLERVPSGRLARPAEIGRTATWMADLRTRRCVVAAATGGETFE